MGFISSSLFSSSVSINLRNSVLYLVIENCFNFEILIPITAFDLVFFTIPS